uniref:Uncharacterized protein n=1 Tax=Cacopsylla melanoneura TaxID=428564 RepID=A0A8D9A6K9_9HEMI
MRVVWLEPVPKVSEWCPDSENTRLGRLTGGFCQPRRPFKVPKRTKNHLTRYMAGTSAKSCGIVSRLRKYSTKTAYRGPLSTKTAFFKVPEGTKNYLIRYMAGTCVKSSGIVSRFRKHPTKTAYRGLLSTKTAL